MTWRRISSLIFAAVFLLSLLPAWGLAQEESSPDVTAGNSLEWTNYLAPIPDIGIQQPGKYGAPPLVQPDAPESPGEKVPIALSVLPTADVGILVGLVNSDRPGGPLGAEILIDNGAGVTWTVTTDPVTGFYSYWLDAGTYDITASATGYLPETAAVTIVGSEVTNQSFELHLDAPHIGIAPLAMEETLTIGEHTSQTLTIFNYSLYQPLEFELGEEDRNVDAFNDSYYYDNDNAPLAPNTFDGLSVGDVPWLLKDPANGAVPINDMVEVDVTFDAGAVPQPGDYMANLLVQHNDPLLASPATIPLTLTVQPTEDMGELEGTISGLGYCDAESYPLAAEVTFEDSDGMSWTAFTDPANGFYHYWLVADTYTVTASAGEHVGAMAVVQVTAQQTTIQDLDLRYVESCMDVTPMSFDISLEHDSRFTDTLSVINNGAGELLWEIRETTQTLPWGDVAWVSEEPNTGTTPSDDFYEVDIIFDPAGLIVGESYTASLGLLHDDPGGTNPVMIPLTLTVQPTDDMGELQGTISGLGYCDAESYPLAAEVVFEDSDGMAWTAFTDPANGSYHYWLSNDTYTVTASAGEHVETTALVQVTAQQKTIQDLDLRHVESCIDVTPMSFDILLLHDSRFTDTLSVINNGAGELLWEIRETTQTLPWGDVEWVSEVPTTGTTLPDDFYDIDIIFDPIELIPDECYTASLGLLHDDPGRDSPVTIPLNVCVECIDVMGVELTLETTGHIYPDVKVELNADIMPDDAVKPYNFEIDYGDGTDPFVDSSSADPRAFNHWYTQTGTYTAEIFIWNCEMTEPVSDTVEFVVIERGAPMDFIYLPIVTRDS